MKWQHPKLGYACTTIAGKHNVVYRASLEVVYPPQVQIRIRSNGTIFPLYSKDIPITINMKQDIECAKSIAEDALKWYAGTEDSVKHKIDETFSYVIHKDEE